VAICFQISVNKERPVVAGTESGCSLSADVSFFPEQETVGIRVQAIVGADNRRELWSWIERDNLKVGDEILIRVVACDQPETPMRRTAEATLLLGAEASQQRNSCASSGSYGNGSSFC
jgi:hypothetical protein